jgi:hypothetical protein
LTDYMVTFPVYGQNNGGVLSTPGCGICSANSSVVTLYSTYGGAAFSGTGTRECAGQFSYETN